MILTQKAYEDMKRRWPELKNSKDLSNEAKRQLARLFEPGKIVDAENLPPGKSAIVNRKS